MDQLVNQVLCDRYRIQSLLGHQAGRKTFLAKDLQTKLPVVIKLLLFGPSFTWQDLKLFEREAEVLKSLNHSAIPKYLDYFDVETELGKGFALVQTYIESKPLQDWVQSGRTFSEAELKAIAKELLGILDYLHSRQPAVVHRDIKPSNILLGDRSGHSLGQIYLIDFGSVQTTVQDGTRTIVGTYGYMPFEQFGGQTTPASDLYALGATLIYLATGQHPNQLPQRKMQILFEDRTNLSQSLRDWLKWMTEPDVELRPKSTNQALEALETPDLQKYGLSSAGARKPAGSKVTVRNTRQMLEILIPPKGFDVVELIAKAWIGLIAGATLILPAAIIDIQIFWPIVLLPVFVTIGGIFHTLFAQVRFCLTQLEVSLSHEILGWKYLYLSEARHNIFELELTHIFRRKDLEGNIIIVPPQIKLWAGTKEFELGGRGRLTKPELDWLAYELSSWLDLPVARTDLANLAKK
ncbi:MULTISPECIES: serine/threonine-protein kinase [Trichocoleus]|uniref:Serine/threonine protein kinase n=1 Tax=Trichocoleus desertorum GB2-A4 TaxID=2933944 RepID=A0ABV0JD34_9CYAN|nr:serine/threonine-protein kinase [Trichocoleus sp. FACHB-46]MBD1864346.1 serine/threonine protein kinase [Trichocoleus sp. FACHB-46]